MGGLYIKRLFDAYLGKIILTEVSALFLLNLSSSNKTPASGQTEESGQNEPRTLPTVELQWLEHVWDHEK